MMQSHYVCYDEDHALFDIFPKFLEYAEKHSMEITGEDSFKFKYTYYDTKGKSILNKGGFCRKLSRTELDEEFPSTFVIEYRPERKSRTQRILSSERKSMSELSKILSVNLHFRELKFRGQNYTASMVFNNNKVNNEEDIHPHLNFIFETGKVESGHTQMECPVAFFSLIDTTASKYNNFYANQIAYKTARCMKLFDQFMKEYNVKRISTHKYDELTELITPDSEFQTDADKKQPN